MVEDSTFADLLQRIRAGDQQAATDLVRHYEPELRRIVRVRLGGAHLRRVLDSVDVCQSVFANFFVRVAAGQFELTSPDQLLKLLATMACNRVNDQFRKQQAARRVDRHLQPWDKADLERLCAPGPSPVQQLAVKELYQSIRALLTDDERYLADQRGLGRDWGELAAELHESPEALRKRLARALDRAGKKLGLDEFDEP